MTFMKMVEEEEKKRHCDEWNIHECNDEGKEKDVLNTSEKTISGDRLAVS